LSTVIKIAICEAKDKPSTPVPLTRHIVASYVVCREIQVDIELPREIIEEVTRRGSIVLDKDSSMKILGLKINENEYVKIYIVR
jgi:hypothetical protein